LLVADWHVPTVAALTALSLVDVIANLAAGALWVRRSWTCRSGTSASPCSRSASRCLPIRRTGQETPRHGDAIGGG
jgi:hypothetical protein